MPRNAPQTSLIVLCGAALLALVALWCAAATSAHPPPGAAARSARAEAARESAPVTVRQVARLQRRASLYGNRARLRGDLLKAGHAVIALNRSTIAANRIVLSGGHGGDVVSSLIALDRAVARLDARAARLALRLGVPHRRLVASRVLALRKKVVAQARALEGLAEPGPAPSPSPSPSPSATPSPSPSPVPTPSPTPTPPGVTPFPTEALPGTAVGELPAGYETSGLAWHERLQRVFAVSDGGTVSSLASDGSDIVNWSVPGDLEGICVADPRSDFVYLGVEHPDGILEFDLRRGAVTRRFDLTPWLTGPANQGLEALAFVPSAENPEGGLFYAGLQADGRIYAFELPIATSAVSTSVSFEGAITLDAGLSDIADLSYERTSGVLLAVFDGPNRLVATTGAGQLLQQWELPGTEQEGITLVDGALYVGEDYGGGSTGRIVRYAPFTLPAGE